MDILVRDHQREETCLLGQQDLSGDYKIKFLSSVLFTQLRQGSPSTHSAEQADALRALAWLRRELEAAEPWWEMAAAGAEGGDRRHVGTVPGKQSPAGDKTRKGPSREAILPPPHSAPVSPGLACCGGFALPVHGEAP